MHPTLRTTLLAVATLWSLPACDSRRAVAGVVVPQPTAPRLESARTTGDAEALAAELLLSSGAAQATPMRSAFVPADAALGDAVAAIALDHLRSQGLGSGAGPGFEGSQRLRRLAQDDDAPADSNGNGTNLDETLAAATARLASFAGAQVPQGVRQPLLPWAESTADLAAASGADLEQRIDRWRTQPSQSAAANVVRLRDVAAAMHGRIQAASVLLVHSRGNLAGATPEEGLLGLLLLEQVLAAEEELVSTLSTAGGPPGPFPDLHEYDPAQGLRWLPREFEAVETSGQPTAYRVRDGASDLEALAALLEAAAELAWFSGPDNTSAAARALFTGPFAPPPPKNPPQPVLSWQVEMRTFWYSRCGGCHLGFATGGFLIDTYASFNLGSPRTRALSLPIVVPGNHSASFIHTILVGPPFPFSRMPLGSSLSQADIATADLWIDQGAHEFPPVVPPPPRPGEDLARACFRNLVAMHLDRTTGALHHRHEGDGRSGIATAAATGRALQALARLRGSMPTLTYEGLDAGDVLALAATFAAQNQLVNGRAADAIALGAPAPVDAAGLDGQAALTAGLLEAARASGNPMLVAAGAEAVVFGLGSFLDAGLGCLRSEAEHAFAAYSPQSLAMALAALRSAVAAGVPGAAAFHDDFLRRLRPVLAYASWSTGGEVPGDGLADTNGDGIPEPNAAGGEHGRLPLLAGAILVGNSAAAGPADGTVTWSQHVRPLLFGKCGECHFSGSTQGNYRLDTVRALATHGDSQGIMPLLVPGDAEASLLYRKLVDRQPVVGAQMPLQRSVLDDRARALVRQWIDAGASGR